MNPPLPSEKRGESDKNDEGKPPKTGFLIIQFLCALIGQQHKNPGHRQEDEAEHRQNERMMARWTRRVGIYTGLLTLISLFTAGILFETDRTLNRTLVASTRAWVSPTEATFDGIPRDGDPLNYKIIYGNTGREPASAFGAAERIGVVDNPGSGSWYDVFKPSDVHEMCSKSGAADDAPTIYPSGLRDYTYRVTDNAMKISPEIASGTRVLFVQGCFTYKTFNNRAESAWCFLLIPEIDGAKAVTGYRSGRCPYGNKAT